MRTLKNLRNIFGGKIFPTALKLRIIPPSTQWENGICVNIRVKNEEDWIKYAILSLRDFADEIIIADQGSTDGTVQIIQDIIEEHPEMNIRFFNRSADTYLNMTKFVLKESRFRWILRFDADMVAKTSGKYNIMNLKKYILNFLNDENYYAIYLNHVYLYYDLFHIRKTGLFHREVWLCTNSKDLCVYNTPKKPGDPIHFFIPYYYKILEIRDPFIFHCNIKSRKRVLEWHYWAEYRRLFEGKLDFDEFVKLRIKEEFFTDSIKEAADMNIRKCWTEVVPFDPKTVDGHPEILEPLLKNPRYKLIYDEKGNIIDRIEPS